MAKALTDLPSDVLTEILSMLPFKTFCASKCVCKTFLHLSSSDYPQLMKMHSANASQIFIFQFHQNWDPSPLFTINLEVDIGATDVSPDSLKLGNHLYQLPHCKGEEQEEYSLVNSCNGLILLIGKEAVICNPITTEYVTIPETELENWKSMWLGFCPGSNKYKILKFISKAKASVLEIGLNSWKCIANTCPFYDHLRTDNQAFSNGVMYWINYCSSKAMGFFDFESERFGLIDLPQINGIRILADLIRVCILQGCLGVSMADPPSSILVIWVLKHGNQNECNMEYVIDCSDQLKNYICLLQPLMIFQDSEIVFQCTSSLDLVFYNVENESLRFLDLGGKEINLHMFSLGHILPPLSNLVVITPSTISLKDALMVDDNVVVRKGSKRWRRTLIPTFLKGRDYINMKYYDLVCHFWPEVKIHTEKIQEMFAALYASIDDLPELECDDIYIVLGVVLYERK